MMFRLIALAAAAVIAYLLITHSPLTAAVLVRADGAL